MARGGGMRQFPLNGALAVITGAGSGIGAALARVLAARGCHLALVDIVPEALEATRAALAGVVRVSAHQMDVTDAGAVAALPGAVEAAHGVAADILVNNAGVALQGQFADVPGADFDWLLGINLLAPIRLTRAFLPMLAARPVAQIVNLSSLFGLVAPPGQAAYATAKFGLRGFSEALRHELAETGIGVSVVHPGGVATAIARNSRFTEAMDADQRAARLARVEALLKMPADKAAGIIADGIARRRARILVGRDAWIVDILQRLFPARYWAIVGRGFGATNKAKE